MLTIIGCGNLNRSDDGVGVVVAQRLADRLRRHPVPGVQVFDCGTAGVDVMFQARGSSALLILDACQSGAEPGSVFEAPGSELASEHEPSFSLHDFRWDHALSAGKKIFRDSFPDEVTVILVEAQSVGYGLQLTEPVSRAADEVYRRALQMAASHAVRRHDAPGPEAGAEGGPLPVTTGESGRTKGHADETRPPLVEIVHGSIRIPLEVYDRFFDGRGGVLLMEREGQLCLIPVDEVAGGLLVKQRNRRGDRVIHAAEFPRNHGIDSSERSVRVVWEPELGGLLLDEAETQAVTR